MPPVSARSSAPSALGHVRIGFGDGYILKGAPTQPSAEARLTGRQKGARR